jgi:hypothetical protein
MGPYPRQRVVFAGSPGNHPAFRSDRPTTKQKVLTWL